MKDLKNLNIWKEQKISRTVSLADADDDITELNLSVRSYNCLKRAGCNTVSDVYKLCMDEESLKKVRNLGAKSASEIKTKLDEYLAENTDRLTGANNQTKKMVIKPAKKVWETEITDYYISREAILDLHKHRIYKVKDLYDKAKNDEPGWFAVRELFEALPCGWRKMI